MGEDPDIERTFRPCYVRFADLTPIDAVFAGIPDELRTLAL
jgi:hypothetical protein